MEECNPQIPKPKFVSIFAGSQLGGYVANSVATLAGVSPAVFYNMLLGKPVDPADASRVLGFFTVASGVFWTLENVDVPLVFPREEEHHG